MIEKCKTLYLKHEEIINYLIVGVLNTIVSFVAYYASVYTFLDTSNPIQLQIANIIGWVVGVAFGYFANRKYVFKSKDPNILKEGLSFATARISTLLLDMGVMWLTVTILMYNADIMKLFSAFLVVVANYAISKIFIFKKSNDK